MAIDRYKAWVMHLRLQDADSFQHLRMGTTVSLAMGKRGWRSDVADLLLMSMIFGTSQGMKSVRLEFLLRLM